MSVPATSRRIISIASGDFRSRTRLFLPTLSWPKVLLQPLRTGGRVLIVSPSADSTLMTSAPMSASIRVQCGPAIVVEKSRTRRPPKPFVAILSSFAATVIFENSLPPAYLRPRRDPRLRGSTGEAILPAPGHVNLPGPPPALLFNGKEKLEPFLHSLNLS